MGGFILTLTSPGQGLRGERFCKVISWVTLVLDKIEIVRIGVGINVFEGLFSFLVFRLLNLD